MTVELHATRVPTDAPESMMAADYIDFTTELADEKFLRVHLANGKSIDYENCYALYDMNGWVKVRKIGDPHGLIYRAQFAPGTVLYFEHHGDYPPDKQTPELRENSGLKGTEQTPPKAPLQGPRYNIAPRSTSSRDETPTHRVTHGDGTADSGSGRKDQETPSGGFGSYPKDLTRTEGDEPSETPRKPSRRLHRKPKPAGPAKRVAMLGFLLFQACMTYFAALRPEEA